MTITVDLQLATLALGLFSIILGIATILVRILSSGVLQCAWFDLCSWIKSHGRKNKTKPRNPKTPSA